jgi:hypothetical protein
LPGGAAHRGLHKAPNDTHIAPNHHHCCDFTVASISFWTFFVLVGRSALVPVFAQLVTCVLRVLLLSCRVFADEAKAVIQHLPSLDDDGAGFFEAQSAGTVAMQMEEAEAQQQQQQEDDEGEDLTQQQCDVQGGVTWQLAAAHLQHLRAQQQQQQQQQAPALLQCTAGYFQCSSCHNVLM